MSRADSDALAQRMVPLAAELVCAVHDHDADAVADVMERRRCDLPAVAVVLAAMVDPDRTTEETLAWSGWHADPVEHLRAAHRQFQRAKQAGIPAVRWVTDGERQYQRAKKADARRRAAAGDLTTTAVHP